MRYRMLTRNNEFSRAYARGACFVHPCLVLYVNKNRCGRVRIGLTATKKVGNAVKRNRARRVMRVALGSVLPQQYLTGWTAKGKGVDLVLVARGVTAKKKSHEIAAVLAKLCKQAGLACRTDLPDAPSGGQAVPAPNGHAQAQAQPKQPQTPKTDVCGGETAGQGQPSDVKLEAMEAPSERL